MPGALTETRRALITGITGQDGSFLAELLLEKGYDVTGVVRDLDRRSLGSSEHLRGQIRVLPWDLQRLETLQMAIAETRPREIYHLAGPSDVPGSWWRPQETVAAIVGSCAQILETVRDVDPGIRVFVAASGAMFGNTPESPQREDSPCRPTTPYGIARLAAHQLVGVMRTHDKLYACSGIMFNHESERRPKQFVTRKITHAAAAISLGKMEKLVLGSLEAIRDWSFAGDIMKGAWLMLQQDHPEDYVLSSGEAHSVAELAELAFACVGLEAARYLDVDPELVSQREGEEGTPSVGDPTKALEQLGWRAQVDFEELIRRMVHADQRSLQASMTRS